MYLVVRLRGLAAPDALSTIFPRTPASIMFLAEIGLGVVVPMVLLAFARFRKPPKRRFFAQGRVVLGFIFQRLNVALTAVRAATGHRYLPSIPDLLISAGLIALGMTIFVLACRHLPVFPEGSVVAEEAAKRDPAAAAVPAMLRSDGTSAAFDRT